MIEILHVAVRFNGGGTRFKAPLLEDECIESSSGILCLSLSSHYGFESSSDRVQFVHASLL